MRSLSRIYQIKHFYTSKNFCLHNLLKYNSDCRNRQKLLLIRFSSSTSSLPNIGVGNLQQKNSENAFDPKKLLWRIINEAFITEGNLNVKPKVTTQQINDGETKMWQVSIAMSWPEKFVVKAISPKKSVAEKNSFYLACQKMKECGILDENNNPVIPQKMNALDNFDNSKTVLCNIYENIWRHCGMKEYIPKFNTFQIPSLVGNEKYWKSELSLLYPEPKTFEACAGRFREAEKIASVKALLWLKEQGIINSNYKLISFSNEEYFKLLKLHSAPYSIHISKTVQNRMKSLQHLLENEEINFSDVNECEPNETVKNSEVYDIITEKLYQDLSEEEIISRSKEMYERNDWHAQNIDPEFQEIKRTVSELPVACRRKEILQLLEENQVLVLSGQTGCGKTTQVPQFILDHYINEKKGALCNIVVTQPRRISAISIAERVATERREEVGETIGYQVRLNKVLPSQKGAILYCTTGMLLRKLCTNPTLKGISHIIVDEIHERNIQIDFLLILLKRLLETNKTIKIILMSASFNTNVFSSYFDKCPVIHVSGRNYPVKEYYLEEILNLCYQHFPEDNKPVLHFDLMVDVIKHIDKHEKPGAILCFLPGWHEMLTVKNKLLDSYSDSSKLMICYAHSKVPVEEQKKLFIKPPDGVRKVILATNVAETSITINDVVYVVDSGLHKGTFFDGNDAVATLATQRITEANVTQRRGRAGRVQPGACYHLYTRKTLMEMKDYPLPELLRMPLETVILDCKLYCPEIKAEDFLSEALNAPDRLSLQAGVNELQTIGILNETEQLTSLGNIVVNFGTHPRLSVACVYAAFLRCLDPVLTICAILTLGKEPFLNSLEDKSLIRKVKETYDNSLISDHLSLSKIYEEWKKLSADSDASEFITRNFLDEQSLNVISDLKNLFADNLFTAGIIDDKKAFSDGQNLSQYNENSTHIPSIFAALTAAFYPNVIKVLQGEIVKNKRLNKNSVIYSLLKGQPAYIQKESIAANVSELPTPWLIYFNALRSQARRLMMTSAVSSVPGICLPLVVGKKLLINEDSSGNSEIKGHVILVLDDHKKLHFCCTREEAELLIQLRNNLSYFFQIYLRSLSSKSEDYANLMSVFNSEFLPVLKNVLETPQVPFTKGLSYKFVNEDLVTEELW